jgi:GNAT superfamily N-acetyltransferase
MTTVIIERLDATPDAVRELVRACSPTSLQRRFFLPGPMDAATVWARYGHYLLAGPPLGAAALAAVEGRPVGLLNLNVVGIRTLELSLLVADAWQHKGVATRLLDAELARPRWAGWTVQALVQPDNGPVRSLLRSTRFGLWQLVARDPSAWEFGLTLEPAQALAVAG